VAYSSVKAAPHHVSSFFISCNAVASDSVKRLYTESEISWKIG